jgi:hypothetical protein
VLENVRKFKYSAVISAPLFHHCFRNVEIALLLSGTARLVERRIKCLAQNLKTHSAFKDCLILRDRPVQPYNRRRVGNPTLVT